MTWIGRAFIPTPGLSGTAFGFGAASATKLYAANGFDNAGAPMRYLREYDPATNAWTARADPASRVSNTQMAVCGTKLYIVGGTKLASDPGPGGGIVVGEWNPATNTWATVAPLPAVRVVAAVAGIGTKLYVAGGVQTVPRLSTLLVWDQPTNTWATLAPLPFALAGAGAVAVGSKLYVLNGIADPGVAVASLLEYDPATNVWTARATPPFTGLGAADGTGHGGVAAVGATIQVPAATSPRPPYPLVLGRLRIPSGADVDTGHYVYVWDQATDTWTAEYDPRTGANDHLTGAAVGGLGGHLYVVGGRPGPPLVSGASSSVYQRT